MFVRTRHRQHTHTQEAEIPASGLTGFQSSLQQEVPMPQSTAHEHNPNVSQATNTGIAARWYRICNSLSPGIKGVVS